MKQAFLYLALLLIGVGADALTIIGVDNSGGGKAVVCRDSQNNIKHIELLDLFEGESIYGLTAKTFGETQDENLLGAKDILMKAFAKMNSGVSIEYSIDQVLRDFRLLPPDVKLAPVDDAAPIVIPVGCELEQLAYYQNNQNLLVDQNLWNALDGRSKAALIMHEVIFLQMRFEGDKDSRNARRIVAHLFSEYQWIPVMDGVMIDDVLCYAKRDSDEFPAFHFYRRQNFDPENRMTTIFQFEKVRQRTLFNKTIIRTLPFPWPDSIGGTYSVISNGDLRGIDPIIINKDVDEATRVTRYYFSEPDGKYFIKCNDKQ